MIRNVVVFGASGRVGRELVRQLRESGFFVRAVLRRDSPIAVAVAAQAHEVAHLADDSALSLSNDPLLLGAHAVVSCLAADAAASLTLRLFERCLDAGSSVRLAVLVALPAAAAAGRMRNKASPLVDAAEKVVDALAAQRQLPFVVVRPALLLDDLADVYRDVEAGVPPTVGAPAARCNPIAAADVARIVLLALQTPRYYARSELLVGGPDVFSWAELVALVADVAGRPRVASLERPGVVQGVVRSLSLLSSPRESLSVVLRHKLRAAGLDCVGAPVGLLGVREFMVDRRIGTLLADGDAAAAAPSDMPRISGCSLLADPLAVDAQSCASVRLSTLLPNAYRFVTKPPTVDDDVASSASACFRYSLRIGRACRLRWQFIVDGRGSAKAVAFRVLQHVLPAATSTTTSRVSSRTPSRTPSRAAQDRSAPASPVLVPRSSTPEASAANSSYTASDADLASSPPVRSLLTDFDAASPLPTAPAPTDGGGDPLPQLFDSANSHSSFRSFKRSSSMDLAMLCERMRGASGLVKTRSYRLRSYDACFVGRDAVDWLIENRIVQSRETAVVLGEVMRSAGHFRSLHGATQFTDDALFYRFAADEATTSAPAPMSTGLESDDDEPTSAEAEPPAADEVEAYPTMCLHRDDDCLRVDLIQGQCLLPSEGLYTLLWTSRAPRFSLGRHPPPRVMYSIALFDGATDADAVALFEQADGGVGEHTFRALSAFAAQQPRELSLAPGELVWVGARNGPWWRGRRASDGAAGWFPAIAVEPSGADSAALLAALSERRFDPRTEGADVLAAPQGLKDAHRYPLVGFPVRSTDEVSADLFVPLARHVRVQRTELNAPQRLDDLLCVAYRSAAAATVTDAVASESELAVPTFAELEALRIADSTQRGIFSLARCAAGEVVVREVAYARLGSQSARNALLNEVATLQQLSCEWFAALVGVWRLPLRVGLLLAPLTGGVLSSLIARARTAPPLDDMLPVRHCLSILLCAARGMSFAHSLGLVLRDLQADTLLVSDDPNTATALVQARLFDVSRARRWLGSAVKNKSAPSTPSVSAAASSAGSEPPAMTPAQLDALRVSPPESVAWRKPFFEPLSDVWSLGCLMIELFSWQKAFVELETEARVLNALRAGQRPDIGSVLPRYRGRRLLALVEACLRPLPEPLVMLADPESGRITVSQVLGDLERLLAEAQQ